MTPAGGAGGAPFRHGWLVIAAVAVLAMLPELVVGLSITDSFRYNIAWTEQFAALFRAGDLYPRWLPAAWDGLGSPTFYFYPPLFFWTASLADLATLGALDTGTVATLASLILLAVSGLAMRAWLGSFVADRAALLGGLAYMLAPYHLYDIYGRGALAEAAAYAWLPLIMLAIRRIGEGRWGAVPLLGASYGALIFSHLPVALLASLFAIPPYVAFAAWRARAAKVPVMALAGGLLGLGLAAAYWLPAIGLTRHISAEALFGTFYDPANWFFWRPTAWPRSGLMLLILPLWIAALLLAAAVAMAARASEHRREALFWSAVTLAALAMIAGALPFLWRLPFLAQVQFPWRLFVVAEFAGVTALALAAPKLRSPLAFAGALPLAAAVAVTGSAIAFRMAETGGNTPGRLAETRADYRDAPEYLPAGSAIPLTEDAVPETAMVKLPQVPLAAAAGARVEAGEGEGGALAVRIDAARPTRVVVRRFYFPHWRVNDGAAEIATAPTPGSRLLSWAAPAGRSAYSVEPGAAPGERAATALSLGALLLLLAGALAAVVGRAKDQRHFHDSGVRRER